MNSIISKELLGEILGEKIKTFRVGDWVRYKETGEQAEITEIDYECGIAKLNNKFWFEFNEIELVVNSSEEE